MASVPPATAQNCLLKAERLRDCPAGESHPGRCSINHQAGSL